MQAVIVPSQANADLEGGGGAINLSWQAPAFNGGSPVLAYLYRYKISPEGSFVGWKDVGLEVKEKVDGLKPGELYTFEVLARNSVGRGPAATQTTTTSRSPTPRRQKRHRSTLSRADDTDVGDDQFRLEWNRLGVTYDGDANDAADSANVIRWLYRPVEVRPRL